MLPLFGVAGKRAVGRSVRAATLLLRTGAAVVLLLALPRPALALTLHAPVGGASIPLGEGRVACARNAGSWTVENGGRSLRPPTAATSVGSVAELRVAPTLAEGVQRGVACG